MLEFIVLGQVPGTHIQLNFQATLLLGLLLLVVLGLVRPIRHTTAKDTPHHETPTETKPTIIRPSTR